MLHWVFMLNKGESADFSIAYPLFICSVHFEELGRRDVRIFSLSAFGRGMGTCFSSSKVLYIMDTYIALIHTHSHMCVHIRRYVNIFLYTQQ